MYATPEQSWWKSDWPQPEAIRAIVLEDSLHLPHGLWSWWKSNGSRRIFGQTTHEQHAGMLASCAAVCSLRVCCVCMLLCVCVCLRLCVSFSLSLLQYGAVSVVVLCPASTQTNVCGAHSHALVTASEKRPLSSSFAKSSPPLMS